MKLDTAEDRSAAAGEYVLGTLSAEEQQAFAQLHTQASIGISVYPRDTHSLDELIKFADQAMYTAKQRGTGPYLASQGEQNAGDAAGAGGDARARKDEARGREQPVALAQRQLQPLGQAQHHGAAGLRAPGAQSRQIGAERIDALAHALARVFDTFLRGVFCLGFLFRGFVGHQAPRKSASSLS